MAPAGPAYRGRSLASPPRGGGPVLAAMNNCPQAASSVPGDGHEVCPVTAIKDAHRRPAATHSDEGRKPRIHLALPPSSDDLERILELGRERGGQGPNPIIDATPRARCHLGRYATALHGCLKTCRKSDTVPLGPSRRSWRLTQERPARRRPTRRSIGDHRRAIEVATSGQAPGRLWAIPNGR